MLRKTSALRLQNGRFFLCVLLLGNVSSSLRAAPASSFGVSGAVAKPAVWTATGLEKAFAGNVQTVHYTLKGVAHTARCVPLLTVIQASQPSFNSHIKNHRLQFLVAIQGFDGYTVDFSLPELLPEFGNRPVWVGLDEDGKPLTDEAGPVELIVPDDVKPGRWVHGVTHITIADGAKSTSI